MNAIFVGQDPKTPHHALAGLVAGAALLGSLMPVFGQTPPITVSSDVPNELNPPFTGNIINPRGPGGAPTASPEQAAAFAWQEFIALNWPAAKQDGSSGKRGTPDNNSHFGDATYTSPTVWRPTVWQTFRGKVEIFPGQGSPPGYPGVGPNDPSYGYDALPQYVYGNAVPACDPAQSSELTPWVNLDEIDQITLDFMYAGVVDPSSSPENSKPQLIRFMAKANREEYEYVARNQWWGGSANPASGPPQSIVAATRDYLAKNQASPPPGSSQYVSLPNGTIEIKAGWRPLNPAEINSGRFHIQRVRFYEQTGGDSFCYRNATWGLVALHIIQKTPSAPYFIYASFEQADNLLTEDGKPVEDVDGNPVLPAPQTATTPQVCLIDPSPQPPTLRPPIPDKASAMGQVVLTDDPKTCVPNPKLAACSPGKRLFYRNEFGNVPGGNDPDTFSICVNKRDNEIPQYAIDANREAHSAIKTYLQQNSIESAPWLYYKLINVQYYPYDKNIMTPAPNGSLYDAQPPYTAKNPARSNFYMANIVVETNRALQLFSGGLSPSISTDWNEDRSEHKNTYYGGNFYSAGGCLGCHGSQGQIPGRPASAYESNSLSAGDFSVILARGRVMEPEGTSPPAMAAAHPEAAAAAEERAPRILYSRNRSLR